jgi:dTDP-4-amino-4,6-dideoxygalactose transaminase
LKIPTLDLEAHHEPILQELGAAALRVIASGRYVLGPEVEAFERELAAAMTADQAGSGSAVEVVAVSSGTDALLATLMALGVGPGDDVVTTPFSFIASAAVIARVGARPVFADIDAASLNLDPARAMARLSPRTRAVIAVDLFGRVAATGELAGACRERGIALVEDAAQAIGARAGSDGPRVAELARAAALSFFPAKNLGGLGDGGAVLTSDVDLGRRLRRLRVQGGARRHHHEALGGNFRLDELQAALLRVKLPHLPRWTESRRRVARAYRELLGDRPGGVELPPDDDGCVWNQFVIRVPGGRRDGLGAHLADRGIGSAVYYPVPLHLQPCFAHLEHRPGDFPVAERAASEVLALPIHPELSSENTERVCAAVREFVGR